MTRPACVVLVLLGLGGCSQPIKLVTEDHISFTSPLAAEFVPTSNDRPVVAMPVEGGPDACASPHVAIVDVDGLLLNTNLTGPYSSGDNPVDLFREKLDTAAA